MRFALFVCVGSLLLACDGETAVDGGSGTDAGPGMDSGGGGTDGGGRTDAGGGTDASGTDAGDRTDASSTDAGGGTDASSTDAGSAACAAMDVMEGTPCGPTERPGRRYVWTGRSCEFAAWCRCVGTDCAEVYFDEAACVAAYRSCVPTCASDSDCPSGREWCESGACVPCDNSGLLCDIACSPGGWATYVRNGCNPCECGPPAGCRSDADCPGERCYAGDFCWCPGGTRSPDCCLGNMCSAPGCPEPPRTGCVTRGCAPGQECVVGGSGTCTPSSCFCGATGSWGCTRDCGGGACVTP